MGPEGKSPCGTLSVAQGGTQEWTIFKSQVARGTSEFQGFPFQGAPSSLASRTRVRFLDGSNSTKALADVIRGISARKKGAYSGSH